MATKNFVPRATGEGQLGTSTKKWKDSHFSGTGSFGHIIVDGNITASGEIRADSFKSVAGGDTIDFNDSLDIAGDITASGVVSASSGAFTSINVDGGTIDGITSFTAGGDIDIGAHDLRAATLTADGLTSGRVVFAGTNGVLSDDSDLSFSGATLTATSASLNFLRVNGNITASVVYADAFNSRTGGETIDFNDDLDVTGKGTFSGNIEANGNIVGDNSTAISGITTISATGNVSSSFTSTGSFGRLEATTIAGHSPITIDSQITFNDSIEGNVSGSATSTGSFGDLIVAGNAITLGSQADSFIFLDGSGGNTYFHYNHNDIIDVYLLGGYERTNITKNIPFICF